VELVLFHPEVAHRDCQHCLKYLYDEKTGKPRQHQEDFVERLATIPAPCRTKSGCPKGTPENPKTLSLKNMYAYQHWRECKAVGDFPNDPIVRRHAAILQGLHDIAEENRRNMFLASIVGAT